MAFVKDKLSEDIKDGKYTIGECIAPREYARFVLENGKMKKDTFVVEGRKIKLIDIRKYLLEKQHKYTRFFFYKQLLYKQQY